MTSQELYSALDDVAPGAVVETTHVALGGVVRWRELHQATLSPSNLSAAEGTQAYTFASPEAPSRSKVNIGLGHIHDGEAELAIKLNQVGGTTEAIPLVREAIMLSMHASGVQIAELDPTATNLSADGLDEIGQPNEQGFIELRAA